MVDVLFWYFEILSISSLCILLILLKVEEVDTTTNNVTVLMSLHIPFPSLIWVLSFQPLSSGTLMSGAGRMTSSF